MTYSPKEIGKRIQFLRNKAGITQEHLAEALHISVSTIGKIERGFQGTSNELIIELAIYFNTTTDYILLGREVRIADIKGKLQAMLADLENLE